MAESRAFLLRFRGSVQGVGFRAYIQHSCRTAGIAGWVRNLDDGSVEAMLIGAEQVVREAIRRIHAGRAHQLTSAEQVEVAVPTQVSSTFEIRR